MSVGDLSLSSDAGAAFSGVLFVTGVDSGVAGALAGDEAVVDCAVSLACSDPDGWGLSSALRGFCAGSESFDGFVSAGAA